MWRPALSLSIALFAGWLSSRPAAAMGPVMCPLPDAGLGHGPFAVPDQPVPTNVQLLLSDLATLEDVTGAVVPTHSTRLTTLRTDVVVTRLKPVEPLQPRGLYWLKFVHTSTPQSFVVGEGPDETPPEKPVVRVVPNSLRPQSSCGHSMLVEVEPSAYAFALVAPEADGPLGSGELFDLFPQPQREWRRAFGEHPDFEAAVVAIDLAGNVSAPSDRFWVDTGVGCASSGGASLIAVAGLLSKLASRRCRA